MLEVLKNRIKELRLKNHLTLQGLGQAVGLKNNTLSRYETGKREPKLETWKKLADFFDVPVSYLQGFNLMDSRECKMLMSEIKMAFDNYNGTYVGFDKKGYSYELTQKEYDYLERAKASLTQQ